MTLKILQSEPVIIVDYSFVEKTGGECAPTDSDCLSASDHLDTRSILANVDAVEDIEREHRACALSWLA